MNREHRRIGIALSALARGIPPFFQRELRAVYGDNWEDVARASYRGPSPNATPNNAWDAHSLLTVMWEQWNAVFRDKLGMFERSLVGELREFRNRWAHQANFDEDDSYRVFDSTQRLLMAIGALEEAEEIENYKFDVLRDKLGRRMNDEQARVRMNRKRIVDVAIYAVCGASLCATILLKFGQQNPLPTQLTMVFTVFLFCYFTYRRLTSTSPMFGVKECPKCSKLIYNEVCPYCDPPLRSSSIIKSGSSSLRLSPLHNPPPTQRIAERVIERI